jgi:membrane protease YdiL (CAAX protease family)
LVAVLPALCEEVLFRGAVFNAMRMKHSLQTSALIAAALFSITHLDPYRLFSVFFIGWYLALAYEYTQTLLAPILIHFLNNGFALVTLNLIADITELETPSLSTSLLIALLSFPFFYFSLEGLRKQWQNSVEKKEEIIQPAEQ